jgi:hypothetical protein
MLRLYSLYLYKVKLHSKNHTTLSFGLKKSCLESICWDFFIGKDNLLVNVVNP